MKKVDLPYLQRVTVKGRDYWYFRRNGKRTRLPDNPDSRAFADAYWSLRSGRVVPSAKTTWGALVASYLASPAYLSLAPGTRAEYRRHCDEIREKNATVDVRRFRRAHAIAARDKLAATPSKANARLAMLSILCRHAMDLKWIDRNPVAEVSKLKTGAYKAWPEGKLRAFENAAAPGTVARTAYELALGTGQRLGDCLAMTWDAFDGEYMTVRQEKTGADLVIYCPARLRAYLDALPRGGRFILARDLTRPMHKRAVQKAVQSVREKIGAEGYVPHGWRYTAAMQLAEAGCSDSEIAAVTGHKTLAMVAKYRAGASQRRASKRAQSRRERTGGEQ